MPVMYLRTRFTCFTSLFAVAVRYKFRVADILLIYTTQKNNLNKGTDRSVTPTTEVHIIFMF